MLVDMRKALTKNNSSKELNVSEIQSEGEPVTPCQPSEVSLFAIGSTRLIPQQSDDRLFMGKNCKLYLVRYPIFSELAASFEVFVLINTLFRQLF